MADKRIPAPAMGAQGTTPATSTTQTTASTAQPVRTIFTTQTAMALLWAKASPALSQPELEWIADGAAEQVGREARTLAHVLESTACLVASDEHSGSFQDQHSTSRLIFNLQGQLNTLAGMAEIADDASQMVRAALKSGGAK